MSEFFFSLLIHINLAEKELPVIQIKWPVEVDPLTLA